MQPLYMDKKVWHPRGHFLTPYLEAELTGFPRSAHDDLSDAESMLFEFLVPPKRKSTRYHAQYLY
jgi:phage terminase large subunit-like protein